MADPSVITVPDSDAASICPTATSSGRAGSGVGVGETDEAGDVRVAALDGVTPAGGCAGPHAGSVAASADGAEEGACRAGHGATL